MKHPILLVAILACVGCGGPSPVEPEQPAPRDARPNILLIVADDLGYSDLGVFGGEIATPQLDALAGEGVRLTGFHAAPSCAPTRASLLSGVDHHRTGLGTVSEVVAPNQAGQPGYEGHLNSRVATIAELLRDAGYRTSMAGKWHLGRAPEQRPFARGFERSFALLNGGASQLADQRRLLPGEEVTYTENGEVVRVLPADFYSTSSYTERLIEFIGDGKGDDGRPFFSYLAFTAPHIPLQAPPQAIARQRGRYDGGWDELRAERTARMIELGLIPPSAPISPRPAWIRAWNELSAEERAESARDMEVYAAMIEELDRSVGRLFEHLREVRSYDDTMIVFLSDNGPNGTTTLDLAELGGGLEVFRKTFDNRLARRGLPGSSIAAGPGWAWACCAPFRGMEGDVTEGGLRVPCLVKPPFAPGSSGGRLDAFTHVVDLMPTFLELAGARYPVARGGESLHPLDGRSLNLALEGGESASLENRELGFELFGRRAFRRGSWKALRLPAPHGTGEWQLYDLAADPGEVLDLAASRPELVRELEGEWGAWAKACGVVEPDPPPALARPAGSGAQETGTAGDGGGSSPTASDPSRTPHPE